MSWRNALAKSFIIWRRDDDCNQFQAYLSAIFRTMLNDLRIISQLIYLGIVMKTWYSYMIEYKINWIKERKVSGPTFISSSFSSFQCLMKSVGEGCNRFWKCIFALVEFSLGFVVTQSRMSETLSTSPMNLENFFRKNWHYNKRIMTN